MKLLNFLLIFLVISSNFLMAQIIKGKVLDSKTKEPIAFANLGIVGKGIGTITNEEGSFELNISNASPEDIIRFSYIGYQALSQSISQYKLKYKDVDVIFITSMAYNLNDVVVRPKIFKTKVVGNTGKSFGNVSFVDYSSETTKIGFEVGTRIKIKERTTYIDEVVINFSKNEANGSIFSLNIYDGKLSRVCSVTYQSSSIVA